MTLYVCLDDRNGMLFNRRRQSRDAAVLEDIRAGLTGSLAIDPFSEKLLLPTDIPWSIAPEDLSQLPPDAHFFLENRQPSRVLPLAETLVIYRWNRHYPADTHWDADLAALGFQLRQTLDFPGRSHDTVTKEVYVR